MICKKNVDNLPLLRKNAMVVLFFSRMNTAIAINNIQNVRYL